MVGGVQGGSGWSIMVQYGPIRSNGSSEWSNMVLCFRVVQYGPIPSMVPWWFRVVQYGLMILNGLVVQCGPILFDGPMVVQGSPIWSNGCS